jgi:hypothetical protein
MESFWDILKRLMESVKSVESDEMLEVDFSSGSSEQDYFATFHTDKENNLVLKMFDPEQWSLVEDMAKFMNKSTEDIVRELDPTSPNVYVVRDGEIELGPPNDEDTF